MLGKLREPIDSLTHWCGTVLALIGLIVPLIVRRGTPVKIISWHIFVMLAAAAHIIAVSGVVI